VQPTWTTLVLGGARSGKSAYAERLAAAAAAPVTYVATGPPPDERADAAWAARVAAHRRRRPPAWATAEVGEDGDLAAVLGGVVGAAVVDSLGTWVATCRLRVDAGALCRVLRHRAATGRPTVVVSEEVGLGVHPTTELGRQFRDVLGELNQAVAEVADRVVLVVAGRVLDLAAVDEDADGVAAPAPHTGGSAPPGRAR